MAYEYRIIPEQNLLVITGSGTVTSADIYRVVVSFQEDPAWDSSMNMLVDWRLVDELLIELDDVKRLALDAVNPAKQELGMPLGPRAAVVLSDQNHETIPLIYAGYLRKSGLETKVFYKIVSALVWLGADPDAKILETDGA